MSSEIKVDTISENTSANGVSIDGLTIKDGGITATTGAIVFNEASADLDFRVESNGDANMLFVDGGQNLVRVGNNAQTNSLIAGNFDLVVGNESSGATGLAILATNNENSYVGFFDQDNSGSFRGTIHYNHTNDYMQIYTNGTIGIRQHSNQVLSASAGVALGVGTANTASNVLDDYEEGTFTMGMADSSGNALTMNGTYAVMHYTKIGNLVHINGLPVISSIASAGADVRITGLPFTANTHATNYSTLAVGYAGSLSIPDDTIISAYVNQSSTIAPMRIWTNTAGTDQLSASQLSDGGEFVISGSYIAT